MASKTTTSTPKKAAPKKPRAVTKKEAPTPKQRKPVFRAGTLIAVLLLAALVGGAYFINKNKETAVDAEATATTDRSFICVADRCI